ncbi:OLC1v1028400C1 [Oldenlandia corymbosa var. corymbosa]|uniref:OLC1v1028400C1 n=1 Tax=Oldenlandia corymbosa var. corymbosa TaxID=529605 RepID=A0AAV1CC49_OLDCO|nr:OLC1v1028400C1 [Oldenlandia corymbosa var. corymbosa]
MALDQDSNLPLLYNVEDQKPISCRHNFAFEADEDDIDPINGTGDFFREFVIESKKLWYLAGPAIFTSFAQYSVTAMTQVFAGQIGTTELAAFSIENNVVTGFAFGIMVKKKKSTFFSCCLINYY